MAPPATKPGKLSDLARHVVLPTGIASTGWPPVRDLLNELGVLVEQFPQLRDSFDPDELPLPFLLAKGARVRVKTARRRRSPMSKAERTAVSRRMKRYWAARRAARKKR